jgi:hypothetical protein
MPLSGLCLQPQAEGKEKIAFSLYGAICALIQSSQRATL